jgi:hypothetical protein
LIGAKNADICVERSRLLQRSRYYFRAATCPCCPLWHCKLISVPIHFSVRRHTQACKSQQDRDPNQVDPRHVTILGHDL